MKTIFIYILLLFFLLISCKQGLEKQKDLISKENKIPQEDSAIIFLNDFYKEYIKQGTKIPKNVDELDLLKEKYLSKKYLEKLKREEWDYDPIVNAQDFDENWIETLNITPIEKKNIYKVCYSYKDFQNLKKMCMKITLIKEDTRYLIENIEEYSNKKTEQAKNNLEAIWKGKYDYITHDKDNFKNEYKIYIYSYNNISILNILDKDTIKYFSKVRILHSSNESKQIALPLLTKEHRKDIDTLYLKTENSSDYYISGSPIYEINPGNNLWNPIKKDDLSD